MEEIGSPSLRIVFDTGNPVGEGHPAPETWDFYQAAKPFIVHIHIKDCKLNNKGETEYTFPGPEINPKEIYLKYGKKTDTLLKDLINQLKHQNT